MLHIQDFVLFLLTSQCQHSVLLLDQLQLLFKLCLLLLVPFSSQLRITFHHLQILAFIRPLPNHVIDVNPYVALLFNHARVQLLELVSFGVKLFLFLSQLLFEMLFAGSKIICKFTLLLR